MQLPSSVARTGISMEEILHNKDWIITLIYF